MSRGVLSRKLSISLASELAIHRGCSPRDRIGRRLITEEVFGTIASAWRPRAVYLSHHVFVGSSYRAGTGETCFRSETQRRQIMVTNFISRRCYAAIGASIVCALTNDR